MTCSRGRLTHEQVVDLLGVIDRKMIHDLAGSILTGNTAAVLDLIDDIYRRGHDMKRLYGDLLEHFRNLTVSSLGNKVDKLIDLPAAEVEQLIQQSGKTSASVINQIFDLLFKQEPVIRLSPQPKTALEITLIRILQAGPTLPIDALIDKLDDLRREIGSAVPAPSPAVIPEHISYAETAAPTHQSELSTAKPVPPHLKGESMPPAAAVEKPIVSESPASEPWKRIIETISSQNPSFAVNLAKCTLKKLADGTLEIDAPGNGFTLTMIQREKNMAILRKVCEEILGGCVDIKIEVSNDKSANHPQKKSTELRDKAVNHPLVAEAIDIFDGHLVDVKVR
jgi:DNA polymerase-3 subunit gamma/tau